MKKTLEETVIFSLTSSIDLADEICKYLNLEKGDISVRHFADGEILVEPMNSVRGKRVYIVQSTCAPVSDRIMEVLIAIDACRRASATEINVVIPYFGYARQDRKARARQPITSKLVANLLEVAGANRVITIDLHAPQIQGFFNILIDDLTAINMMGQYFRNKQLDNVVVISPDHGGTNRARILADFLDAPIAIIDKRRPKPNVAEAMNIVGDVEGKVAIIVDDICDTAGSLVAGIDILKKYGAKEIYCAITHGILSGPAIERIQNSPIKEFVITNTVPLSVEKQEACPKITVLSVAYMLAKTIESIETHSPVSAVYDLFNK